MLSCLLGCNDKAARKYENSAKAKYILVTALEAWKTGETESLAKRDPVIRFVDDDQISGMQLIDYEIESEVAPIKPFDNVRVALTVRHGQSEQSKKIVTYQIGVEPGLTVLRSDN